MRKKEVLFAAVIGGVIGAVLVMMAVCSVMPLGAQNGDATFGEITCTGLSVVDDKGMSRVMLFSDEHGGRATLMGKTGGVVALSHTKQGGRVQVFAEGAYMLLEGLLGVRDNPFIPRASMEVNESGNGMVMIRGISGEIHLRTDEGAGYIGVYGDNNQGVELKIDKHGGRVGVFGKGNDKTCAVMGVNEYGNGAVSTWDKNGYRLASLK